MYYFVSYELIAAGQTKPGHAVIGPTDTADLMADLEAIKNDNCNGMDPATIGIRILCLTVLPNPEGEEDETDHVTRGTGSVLSPG